MKDCIATACVHYFGGRKMIYASNIEAEWLDDAKDVRECYNKLFDKTSGTSIVMLSPNKTGIILVVSKIIPNRFGDNLTAYLQIPYGLDISGESLQGILFDVISALAQNRKDTVVSCLSSVSKQKYDILPMQEIPPKVTDDYAYRIVNSGGGRESLTSILNNLFQDYYFDYKYIFLAIDNQYIANKEQHTNLTEYPIKNWRIKKEMTKVGETVESYSAIKDNSTEGMSSVINEIKTTKITSEWLKKNTKIHGFLSLFLDLIIVCGLISVIISFFTNAENTCLKIADIANEIFLLIVAGYTTYLFRKRRPNAVFWGIVYLVVALLTNVFGLISGVSGSMLSVSAIIWEILWLSYMIFSDQAQRIIPKSFRKVTFVDWTILIVLLLLPVFSFIVGCSQNNYSEKHQQIESKDKVALAYNQRTDGRIFFTIPDGFECKSEDYDSGGTKITFFSLVNDSIENCTIFSSYDSDKTYSNLDSYWNAWKADGITDSNIGDIDKGLIKVNGNDCLYCITKLYVGDRYLFWHFYLLFDDKTGIVMLLTCYDDVDSPNYIEEILESVQFDGV